VLRRVRDEAEGSARIGHSSEKRVSHGSKEREKWIADPA
jgi:hypothetical protein